MAKRELTEDQKEVLRTRLERARAAKRLKTAEAELVAVEAETKLIIVEGEPLAPPIEDVEGEPPTDEPATLDAFGRFLITLSAETRELLNEAELHGIFDAQIAAARTEKKAAAKKAVMARALHHARVEEGLMPQNAIEDAALRDRMQEMVRFTVDLPELGDVGLRVDGNIYLHKGTYNLTRAQYESFREMVYKNQQAELDFEGRGRGHWLRKQARGSVGESLNGIAA